MKAVLRALSITLAAAFVIGLAPAVLARASSTSTSLEPGSSLTATCPTSLTFKVARDRKSVTVTCAAAGKPTATAQRTSTRPPSVTATRTPRPTTTQPPASTPTHTQPAPTPTWTPPPPTGGHFPFGPFHLPVEEFGAPFTGGMVSLKPDSAASTLSAARAAGLKLFINLGGGRGGFQKPDGAFDLEAWKDRIDPYVGIIEPFIADGTIVGHLMMDEPQDPGNWNGQPIPCADVEAAASYSKQLWPNMQAGAGTHATWINGQACDWQDFAFTLTPYVFHRPVTPQQFMQDNLNAGHQAGIKVYLSMNVLDGGSAPGTPMTADQIREAAGLFIAHPNVCGLTMWKWDRSDGGGYFNQPDIAQAVAEMGALAAARGACP